MAETSVATPGSNAESGTPAKPSASKDRTCPYCHTQFTSSSLGRHLDLYIKEKNPKPPDGIHDIEQIRRSRGNITRRQARTSSAKRETSQTSSTKPTTSTDHRSPSVVRRYTNGDHVESRPATIRLNHPSWEATGVINDIPAATRDGRYDARRDHARRLATKNEIAQKKKTAEERDRGRAAELALREVLDSIKAANAKANPMPPFPFDFFGQSFPSLCLRCLVRPATISSTQLIPNSTSWPISTPGATQLEPLRQQLSLRLRFFHQQRRKIIAASTTSTETSEPISISTENSTEEEDRPYYEHLTNTHEAWMKLPDSEKREIWQIESLRAFAREEHEHGQTQIKLQRLEEETANLRIQLERLNQCQQPREYILHPPNQLPIPCDVAQLVRCGNLDPQLDYDALVDKWKSRIQANRNVQKPLPPPDLPPLTPSAQTNGVSQYAHESTNGDPAAHQGPSDDDLMDALGDEDDELPAPGRAPTAPMDRGMLDPKLRSPGDEVMQGIEGDGEGFVGGRLLAGLREYAVEQTRGLQD